MAGSAASAVHVTVASWQRGSVAADKGEADGAIRRRELMFRAEVEKL